MNTTTTNKSAARDAGQNPTGFRVGDRVAHSYSSLRGLRDYWLSCGRSQEKSAAKEALDKKTAERGIVTNIRKGSYAWVIGVDWENLEYPAHSELLSHMIAKAS